MKTVAIESPLAGDVEANLTYLRRCMADCIANDEAPYASHGLYTQPGVLDDNVPKQRVRGIRAGFAIAVKMDVRVFYIDLGMTDGMLAGLVNARAVSQPVEFRALDLTDDELAVDLLALHQQAKESHRD